MRERPLGSADRSHCRRQPRRRAEQVAPRRAVVATTCCPGIACANVRSFAPHRRPLMVRAADALWKHDWIPGLLAVAIVLLLHGVTDALAGIEHQVYDFGVSTAAHLPAADISIITVDDAGTSPAGPWPVPREHMARLVDELTQAGASLVVFALPLGHPQPEPANEQLRRVALSLSSDPALAGVASVETLARTAQSAVSGDERLARSLRSSGRVVLASRAGAPPIAPLASAAAAVAEMSFRSDADGVLRSQALFAGEDGKGAPVLPLVVAAHRLGVAAVGNQTHCRCRRAAWVPGCCTPKTATACGHFYAGSGGNPAFARVPLAEVLSERGAASRFAGHTVTSGRPRRNGRRRWQRRWQLRWRRSMRWRMSARRSRKGMSSCSRCGRRARRCWWRRRSAALLMWQLPRLRGVTRLALRSPCQRCCSPRNGRCRQWSATGCPWWSGGRLWLGVIVLAMWPRPTPAPSPWHAVERRRVPRNAHAAPLQPVGAPAAPRPAAPSTPMRSGDPPGMTLGRYRRRHEDRPAARWARCTSPSTRNSTRGGDQDAVRCRREFDGDALAEARAALPPRSRRRPAGSSTPTSSASTTPARTGDLACIVMEYPARPRPAPLHAPAPRLLPVPRRAAHRRARGRGAAPTRIGQGVVHRDIKPANVMVDLPPTR